MTVLNGMTWDHPRGYAPLVEGSRRWKELSGVEIHWDRRSLQDFEAFPVAELARQYDLMIIDHPHVGQAVREACLLPLDEESDLPGTATVMPAVNGPCRWTRQPRFKRGAPTGWTDRCQTGARFFRKRVRVGS